MQRADLLKAALGLSPDEREQLAEELWASLDGGTEGELQQAWANEIERRMDEADVGTLPHRRVDRRLVEAVPWSEVRARALDAVRRSRGR